MNLRAMFSSPRLLTLRTLITFLLVGAIAGCSKPSEKAPGKSDAEQRPLSEQTEPTTQKQVQQPVKSMANNTPQPSAPSTQELEWAAKAMGIPQDRVLLVLQRQEALSAKFQQVLKSDDASQVVPMLLGMADAVRGTPEAGGDGQQLPSSFLKMLGYDSSSVPGLSDVEGISVKSRKPGFMGLSVEKLPEQNVLATATVKLAKQRPDLLASLAAERAKNTVPTAADYILFNAIIDGLADSPFLVSTGDISEKPKALPYGSELLALANAPNPIYRLLAVRVASSAEADKAKLIGFYSGFLNETDPIIQQAAVDGLEGLQEPGALNVLRKFDAKAKQEGNADVSRAAQDAIRRLSARE